MFYQNMRAQANELGVDFCVFESAVYIFIFWCIVLVGNGGHVVFVSLRSGCDGNLGEKSMSANALK